MTKTKSKVGASAVVFVGCALVVVACGSDATTPVGGGGAAGAAGVGGRNGTGGHGDVGGLGGAAGGPGSAGSAGQVSGTGGGGGSGGKPNNCTKLPANLLLTDFSPMTIRGVTDGTSWKASKTDFWGNSSSLTGGDVFYQGKAPSAATVKLQGETLTITASIEPGDYAGYMFNFKPACTNASTTQGLRFDVKPDSTIGNATLKVQMQQKSDYPSTANPSGRPGNCVPTSVDTQYSDCLSPATTVVSSGTAVTAGTVDLPWTSFGDGKPVANIDNTELMAIQWQFECPSTGGGVVALADIAATGGDNAGGSSGSGTAGGDTGGVSGGGPVSTGGSSGNPGVGGWVSGGAGGGGPVIGTGGSSGNPGVGGWLSGGAGGDGGTGGGTAGTVGSGGWPTTSGGSNAGGSSGSAGSGGTSGTPSPCVVSIVIDNVTFY